MCSSTLTLHTTTNTTLIQKDRHRRAHGPGAPDWRYCKACTKKACKISVNLCKINLPKPLTNTYAHGILKIQRREKEVLMMMTKEQMMDDVIRRYGFENKWTVWFCELAEVLTESQLFNAYILLDANVLFDEEE